MSDSSAPIPVTVIGGFLGAGKTTLLNKLLSSESAPRCSVLVNDFGDINIDASLIRSNNGKTIALKNGCVCCTIGNDLGAAISDVLESDLNPDRIMIEASGVSNPDRVMDIARIAGQLAPGGIYVLADGVAIGRQLKDRWIADTVLKQLNSADYLVISKTEAMSPDEQIQTLKLLISRAPNAVLKNTSEVGWCNFSDHAFENRKEDSNRSGNDTHNHFFSRTLRSQNQLDIEKLAEWLKRHSGIYRMKGWFIDPASNTVNLLQVVDKRIEMSPSQEEIENQFVAIVIGNEKLPESEDIVSAIT